MLFFFFFVFFSTLFRFLHLCSTNQVMLAQLQRWLSAKNSIGGLCEGLCTHNSIYLLARCPCVCVYMCPSAVSFAVFLVKLVNKYVRFCSCHTIKMSLHVYLAISFVVVIFPFICSFTLPSLPIHCYCILSLLFTISFLFLLQSILI